jgi:hypothetical protein
MKINFQVYLRAKEKGYRSRRMLTELLISAIEQALMSGQISGENIFSRIDFRKTL